MLVVLDQETVLQPTECCSSTVADMSAMPKPKPVTITEWELLTAKFAVAMYVPVVP